MEKLKILAHFYNMYLNDRLTVFFLLMGLSFAVHVPYGGDYTNPWTGYILYIIIYSIPTAVGRFSLRFFNLIFPGASCLALYIYFI